MKLFDIEARLTDTKTYTFSNEDRGDIRPGEKLHGMLMRLTVDEDMLVHACEANTEYGPYAVCPAITPNFAALAGLKIGPGWNRKVKEVVGGVKGCTHLVELLGPMGVSREHLLEKWFRDVRITDIYEGTGEIQRMITARELLGYTRAELN